MGCELSRQEPVPAIMTGDEPGSSRQSRSPSNLESTMCSPELGPVVWPRFTWRRRTTRRPACEEWPSSGCGPALTRSKEFVDLFLEEAQTASLLAHPNICQVHELSADSGEYFMVMEYLEGGSPYQAAGQAIVQPALFRFAANCRNYRTSVPGTAPRTRAA